MNIKEKLKTSPQLEGLKSNADLLINLLVKYGQTRFEAEEEVKKFLRI